jgi:hypothetical protein
MKKIIVISSKLMFLLIFQFPVLGQNEVPINAVNISWNQIVKYDSLNPGLKIKKIEAENGGVINPPVGSTRLKTNLKSGEIKQIGTVTEVNPTASSPKGRVMNEAFPCRNFTALDDNNTSIPPDVNGTVGFNHLMTTLNSQVRIQNKNGGIISTVALLAFWQAYFPSVTDVFDPKITYDPYNHKFIFVTVAQRRSGASSLLIALSQTPDPTGNWWGYQIDADGDNNEWFDYPSVGFNKKWIAISGNMFGNPLASGGFTTTRTFVFRKFDLYAGAGTSYNSWDRSDYSTICPAITYDNGIEELWCVTNDDVNDNDLRLFKISGATNTPSFTEDNWITVGTDWAPNGVNAPQSGGTSIDLGDQRIQNVFYRAGSIWSAQTIFMPTSSPTYAGLQIARLNPYAGSHIETIRFLDASGAGMYGYPSIAVNDDGDFFVGYGAFFTTTFASGYFSYRRNGSGSFEHFNIANGLANYVKNDRSGKNRWGDYTATAIDPEDDKAVWTIQEYARTGNTWGTNWAKVCPISCPVTINVSGNYGSGTLKKWEATNFVNSTAINFSGTELKYDAGTRIILSSGFRAYQGSTFKAYIDGCGGVR